MADVRQVLDDATQRLTAAGVESPRVDAELLLSHVLGAPRGRLLMISSVHPSAVVALDRLLTRRARREPLQHLVGRAPFRHVEVAVGSGVFVPRPETELLVDAVLPALTPDALAVDLCTGSGALAVSLATEVPGLRVVAVEESDDALAWLQRNARGTSVEVVRGDVTNFELLVELRGQADAVVCNPPYVPIETEVAPEVRFDPDAAVFAGPDGLALIPHVIARAAELLRPGGIVAIEHDESHVDAVLELLTADGRWRDVEDHRDLADRPRFVTAIRA
jgi:release factor glutamine methyltransferase